MRDRDIILAPPLIKKKNSGVQMDSTYEQFRVIHNTAIIELLMKWAEEIQRKFKETQIYWHMKMHTYYASRHSVVTFAMFPTA